MTLGRLNFSILITFTNGHRRAESTYKIKTHSDEKSFIYYSIRMVMTNFVQAILQFEQLFYL